MAKLRPIMPGDRLRGQIDYNMGGTVSFTVPKHHAAPVLTTNPPDFDPEEPVTTLELPAGEAVTATTGPQEGPAVTTDLGIRQPCLRD
jgi:hypothetical protein